ncbi:hypothetical protein TALC_01043 [Thermoplasmatales archaeon BRNA1]|nr:hypothetical protein TALC_01043 [Thermoplasmatales archaeon BRNA1]
MGLSAPYEFSNAVAINIIAGIFANSSNNYKQAMFRGCILQPIGDF